MTAGEYRPVGGTEAGRRMSTVFLSIDVDVLAAELARSIADETVDHFRPTEIIVPNSNLRKWLQIRLARTLGVAANLRFEFFERGLWAVLARLDPAGGEPAHLGPAEMRDMILATLLSAAGKPESVGELAPLIAYLPDPNAAARDFHRKVWQLATRLASLFREYEYHRYDMIEEWLAPEPPVVADEIHRAERELFRRIFLPDGLRDRLAGEDGERLQTLEHYGADVMARLEAGGAPSSGDERLHVFGLASMSSFHCRALRRIAWCADVRLYVPSPLVGRLSTGETDLPTALRTMAAGEDGDPGDLHRRWGAAGRESLYLIADLLAPDRGAPSPFRARLLAGRHVGRPAEPTVLRTLQDSVLAGAAPEGRLPQDSSLQIAACPELCREVETVRNSVISNMLADPELQLTDIAVLVTDMAAYRPVVQAVFGREPRCLPYNLTDFTAAQGSLYGDAVLGLLDLATGRIARAEALELFVNPCFLAGTGVTRDEVLQWREWIESLGIFHSADRADKQARGYGDSELHTWRQGLRRLRLGTVLDAPGTADAGPFDGYQGVIPHADPASCDRDGVSAFSETVELLLASIGDLRRPARRPAGEWVEPVQRLLDTLLAVPNDHPREEAVASAVRDGLSGMHGLAGMLRHAAGADVPVGLTLVREAVGAALEGVPFSISSFLVGGVTVSEFQPMRPIPFNVIYVLGLGEQVFPGRTTRTALDIRAGHPRLGEVDRPDANRLLMLETLVSARRKLYLSFVARDLQKDEELYPSSVVVQLRGRAEEAVVEGGLREVKVPLHGSDPRYLYDPDAPPGQDLLVNYSEMDRLLCLRDPQNRALVEPAEVASVQPPPALPWLAVSVPTTQPPELARVSVRELRRMLANPIEALLARHCGVVDEADEELVEDEPFFTGRPHDGALFRAALATLVTTAMRKGRDRAYEELEGWTRGAYDARRRRSLGPDVPYAAADEDRLWEMASAGAESLRKLLAEPPSDRFLDLVAIGDVDAPGEDVLRLPALALDMPADSALPTRVEIHGRLGPVWRTEQGLETLVITTGKIESPEAKDDEVRLNRYLVEPFLAWLVAAASGDECSSASLRGHVLGSDGKAPVLHAWSWDSIGADAAREYVRGLVTALLLGGEPDVLPFEVIAGNKAELLSLAGQADVSAQEYRTLLIGALLDDAEALWPKWRRPEFLTLIPGLEERVPLDAQSKVRARLGPLAAYRRPVR